MEDFIDIHLNSKLYLSKHIIKPYYSICFSDLIDDSYWNYAFLKDTTNIEQTLKSITNDMHELNRVPTLYLSSNISNEDLEKYIENNGFTLQYTDVWMTLDNLDNFLPYKSSLDFKTRLVDKLLKDSFVQSVMIGFSGDNEDDPYKSLGEGYKKSLERTFMDNDSEYKIIHFAGLKNNEIISTASVAYKGDAAVLYNITTNRNYKKLGVCRQMMYEIISNLKTMDIKKICVQTEKGFYPEQIYKKFGFKEFMLGKAFMLEE